MSKADGWEKLNAYEWRKMSPQYRATISQVTGNGSWPYMWSVYGLPREDWLDERGIYRAWNKGSEKTLAAAKAAADRTIAEKQQ